MHGSERQTCGEEEKNGIVFFRRETQQNQQQHGVFFFFFSLIFANFQSNQRRKSAGQYAIWLIKTLFGSLGRDLKNMINCEPRECERTLNSREFPMA